MREDSSHPGDGKDDPGAARAREPALLRMAALLAVAAATLLTACSAESSSSGEQFRLGTAQAIDTLNPFAGTTREAESFFQLTYPRLVQWNEEQTELVGDFAESWKISGGGRRITFETHTGEWSDGKPLTAEDAAWSINFFVEYGEGGAATYSESVQGVESAEATDEDTLVVRYDEVQADPLSKLQRATILPRHVWQEHATGEDAGGLLQYTPSPSDLVTGGPFTVRRFDPDGGLVLLERAEGFYGDRPTVDVLGLQAFTSPDALLAALQNGEIDGIETLPPTTPTEPLEEAGAQIGRGPGRTADWMILNSNKDKPEHRELLDPRVRLALDLAIDREAIVETALRGNGQPGASFVPASNAFHDDSIAVPAFDLDRANRLLDDAGFERGGDGVRIADGQRMEYTVLSAPDSNARSFQIVRDGWAEIGVRVSRRQLDVPALVDAMLAPDGQGLDYDIAMWGYNVAPDPSTMLELQDCTANTGLTHYCDREYDRLYKAQSVARNPDRRARMIDRMQQIIFEDKPYLVMDYQDAISALASGWEAPPMTPSGFFQMDTSKLPLTTITTE